MTENNKEKEGQKKPEWKADTSLTMEIKKGEDWKPDHKLTMRLKETKDEK